MAAWYADAGYTVLERNWRCRQGELDLVVALGSTVVFCEVKTRSGPLFGAPVEAVTWAKQRRLRRLAVAWLQQRSEGGRSPAGAAELRFDVASVRSGPGGPTVEVLEGVF